MNNLEPFESVNIVTGEALSILQMVKEFAIQSVKTVRYQIGLRRPGDAPAVWADATKAINKIGLKANLGVIGICQDTWHWQDANTVGYTEK